MIRAPSRHSMIRYGLLLVILVNNGIAVAQPPTTDGLRQRLVGAARGRFEIEHIATLVTQNGRAAVVTINFGFKNPYGEDERAAAKIYLPPATLGGPYTRVGLLYAAGYEMPETWAKRWLEKGLAVATPVAGRLNPIARMVNLDVDLLHMVRGLPWVDDSRVVIWGASAGGYMTLMLAAETFPLAEAISEVPPVNWAYTTAYFLANEHVALGNARKDHELIMPVFAGVVGGLSQLDSYWGRDVEDPIFQASLPVSHIQRITCPVTAIFSSGDVLAPIYQLGDSFVQPLDRSLFPRGFVIEPAKLIKNPLARRTLLDVLPRNQYSVATVKLPANLPLIHQTPQGASSVTIDIPTMRDRQWNIVVVDDGPVRPEGGHFQHMAYQENLLVRIDRAVDIALERPMGPQQLTIAKLEVLMARYGGREWIQSGLRHLDDPRAERRDVVRGLLTYVTQSRGHVDRFLDLYGRLPADCKRLPRNVASATPETLPMHLQAIEF